MKASGAWREVVVALWLGVAGLTFFAAQLGVSFPMGGGIVLYSLVLVTGVIVALVQVRQKGDNNRVE